MSGARLNREEIYRYAEQVLIGDNSLDDLKEKLHEDDLNKVRTVVNRGPAVFAEERGEKVVNKTKLRRILARTNTQPGKAVYIPLDPEKVDFITLIQNIPFNPFPIRIVLKETVGFRSSLMTSLLARMKVRDVAIFLSTLTPEQQEPLLSCTSERLQKELQDHLEKLAEEESVSTELPLAQYSLVTTLFMREQDYLAPSIREGLDQYVVDVEKDIVEYCRQMPQRLGLVKDLDVFSDQQWMRLAGMTPREEMAQLHAVLERSTFEKLVKPLPARQREDLNEKISFWERHRRHDLRRLGQIVSCLKNWTGIVEKVKAADID